VQDLIEYRLAGLRLERNEVDCKTMPNIFISYGGRMRRAMPDAFMIL